MCWSAYYVIWFLRVSACVSTCTYNFKSSVSEQYKDTVPSEPPRLQVSIEGALPCLAFCTNAGAHVSVVYVPTTTSCMCYFTPLPSMTLTNVAGAVAFEMATVTNDYVESWITRVIRESSHYVGRSRYPSTSMIGASDYYPNYGNTNRAWCPGHLTNNQFVELEISEEIYISEIQIYEIYNGGGVSSVSILDSNSAWVNVWTSPLIERIETSRIFKPRIKLQDFKSNAVRLDVDLSTHNAWCEFDAVKVTGTRTNTRTRYSLV